MGVKRPSANERRLEHLRAVRDEFYAEPSVEELLAQKDARIRELSAEVDRLRSLIRSTKRPAAESDPAERRTFDFYRD